MGPQKQDVVVRAAIRQLTVSPEEQPKKIGFQLREKRALYGRRG